MINVIRGPSPLPLTLAANLPGQRKGQMTTRRLVITSLCLVESSLALLCLGVLVFEFWTGVSPARNPSFPTNMLLALLYLHLLGREWFHPCASASVSAPATAGLPAVPRAAAPPPGDSIAETPGNPHETCGARCAVREVTVGVPQGHLVRPPLKHGGKG